MDLLLRASNEGLLRPRVARAQKIIRLHPLLCSGSKGSARLSFHPFHTARSASKKGTWPLPPHPSEAARCASTEDHLAPSPPLFREQEDEQVASRLPSPIEGRLTEHFYRRSISP